MGLLVDWCGISVFYTLSGCQGGWFMFLKKNYRKMKIEIQRNNFFEVISRKIWNAMFSGQLKLFFLKHNLF